MIADMRWWLDSMRVDGFRCDFVAGVPLDFWVDARSQLAKARPDIFLLAEAESPAGQLDAAGERDRPTRRRIAHMVARLSVKVTTGGTAATRAAARRAGELLCAEADFVPEGVQLFTRVIDLDAEPAPLLAELEHLAALHADRPALAVRTAETQPAPTSKSDS